MWYSVQYVCSFICLSGLYFSDFYFILNLLYQPFILYYKGLLYGNFLLPYH